jgi:hypothetical protein
MDKQGIQGVKKVIKNTHNMNAKKIAVFDNIVTKAKNLEKKEKGVKSSISSQNEKDKESITINGSDTDDDLLVSETESSVNNGLVPVFQLPQFPVRQTTSSSPEKVPQQQLPTVTQQQRAANLFQQQLPTVTQQQRAANLFRQQLPTVTQQQRAANLFRQQFYSKNICQQPVQNIEKTFEEKFFKVMEIIYMLYHQHVECQPTLLVLQQMMAREKKALDNYLDCNSKNTPEFIMRKNIYDKCSSVFSNMITRSTYLTYIYLQNMEYHSANVFE